MKNVIADYKVVKSLSFNEVREGKKPFEYRLKNDYWTKRLVGRSYENVHFKYGYPKADDLSKIHTVPYRGYEVQTITHPHFGSKPVEVFAIYADDSKFCECGKVGIVEKYGKAWCDDCFIEVV